MTFTREIVIKPAYDKRDADPRKNYGIHGVHIWFNLKHSSGEGLTFSISTNWHLPHIETAGWERWMLKPQAFGVDIHKKAPHYEGQSAIDGCNITGGPCYCDGSALLGDEFLQILISGGDEALWARMEQQYVTWGGAQ